MYIAKQRYQRKHRAHYGEQIFCLAALAVTGTVRFGTRVALVVAVCVAASVFTDFLFCKMSGKTYSYKNLSAFCSGACIALMSPSTVPLGAVVFGCAAAMGVKHIFGGKDNYIFNPTAASFCLLIICFPAQFLLYANWKEKAEIFADLPPALSFGVEGSLRKLEASQIVSPIDILLGNFSGPCGTVHVAVIAACAIVLVLRRSVSFAFLLSAFAPLLMLSLAFPGQGQGALMLITEFAGGFTLFTMLFLANDPQTLPATRTGRVCCGLLFGVLVFIFRGFGRTEGYAVFALLIVNVVSLRMDSLSRRGAAYARTRFNMFFRKTSEFEKFRTQAATGGALPAKSLGDTQEIDVFTTRYEMPVVHAKAVSARRSRSSEFARRTERFFSRLAAKIFPGSPLRKESVVADEPMPLPEIPILSRLEESRQEPRQETNIKEEKEREKTQEIPTLPTDAHQSPPIPEIPGMPQTAEAPEISDFEELSPKNPINLSHDKFPQSGNNQ